MVGGRGALVKKRMEAGFCVCVCACVRACVRVCVCVCVNMCVRRCKLRVLARAIPQYCFNPYREGKCMGDSIKPGPQQRQSKLSNSQRAPEAVPRGMYDTASTAALLKGQATAGYIETQGHGSSPSGQCKSNHRCHCEDTEDLPANVRIPSPSPSGPRVEEGRRERWRRGGGGKVGGGRR